MDFLIFRYFSSDELFLKKAFLCIHVLFAFIKVKPQASVYNFPKPCYKKLFRRKKLVSDPQNDVIANVAIYGDDTTLYSKCDKPSDLWQQLDLTSELESFLQDTVVWGR